MARYQDLPVFSDVYALTASAFNGDAMEWILSGGEGHAFAAMTLDVYSDLFDDDLDSVSTALDAARRAANAP